MFLEFAHFKELTDCFVGVNMNHYRFIMSINYVIYLNE